MYKINYLLGLPKTIYFNLKYLPIKQAIKLPIFISHKVKFLKLKGKVEIDCNDVKFGFIKIGYGNIGIFDRKYSRTLLEIDGKIIFRGSSNIGHGCKLSIHGLLEVGNNTSISAESSIVCLKKVSIGNDCLISWENLIMDTDFHIIKDENGDITNKNRSILIGNHVWIGCRCTILKGSKIYDNNIIAANTLIANEYENSGCIIGGQSGKILKKDRFWKA